MRASCKCAVWERRGGGFLFNIWHKMIWNGTETGFSNVAMTRAQVTLFHRSPEQQAYQKQWHDEIHEVDKYHLSRRRAFAKTKKPVFVSFQIIVCHLVGSEYLSNSLLISLPKSFYNILRTCAKEGEKEELTKL